MSLHKNQSCLKWTRERTQGGKVALWPAGQATHEPGSPQVQSFFPRLFMYLKEKKPKVEHLLDFFALRISQQLISVFQDHDFVLWHLTFARIPLWACLSFLTTPKSFPKCLNYWLVFLQIQLSSSSNFIWLSIFFQEEKNKINFTLAISKYFLVSSLKYRIEKSYCIFCLSIENC